MKKRNWLSRLLWMGHAWPRHRETSLQGSRFAWSISRASFAWTSSRRLARELGGVLLECIRSVCWFARTWNVKVRFPAVATQRCRLGERLHIRWCRAFAKLTRRKPRPDSFAWAGSRRHPGETGQGRARVFASAVTAWHRDVQPLSTRRLASGRRFSRGACASRLPSCCWPCC